MPTSPALRIWCNYPLNETAERLLREGTRRHDLALYEQTEQTDTVRDSADAAPEDMEILFGQPDPEGLLANARLRWVQLSSAGYTRYDRARCSGRGERS